VTEKLYYTDPLLLEFDATVVDAAADAGRCRLVLDRTCFYPGGGGQPADTGVLAGGRVVAMAEADGRIVHVVEPAPAGLAPGAAVHGAVDAARRLDYMEQHTGEHLFAQALKRAAGLQTVSVHFSDDDTAIELAVESVDERVLREAEEIANAAIRENRSVVTHEVGPAEASRFPLRRAPPDDERLRIVEVDSFDWVACCGVHVPSAGGVSLIKAAWQEKMRGHARVHLLIGRRALADYGRKIALSQELTRMLTCGEPDIPRRVRELLDGQKEAARELQRMQAAQAAVDAEAAVSGARAAAGAVFVSQVRHDAGPEYLKAFVERVTAAPGRVCVAIDQGAEGFQWIVAHSIDGGPDLPGLLRDALAAAEAKGGGRGARMQGMGGRADAAAGFARDVEARIERALTEGTL
jgi:alanyl-tRNA synthetase